MYFDYDKFDTSANNRAPHVAWLRLHHYIHQQFKLIADRLSLIASPAQRAALAMKIFG